MFLRINDGYYIQWTLGDIPIQVHTDKYIKMQICQSYYPVPIAVSCVTDT